MGRSQNLVKGVIVQFGGQTPLNLASGLKEAGVPILGTTVESLDAAGDREQFRELLQNLDLKQPENGIARSVAEARTSPGASAIRCSSGPASCSAAGRWKSSATRTSSIITWRTRSRRRRSSDAPILVDKFLDAATEVDVDCLADYDPQAVRTSRECSRAALAIIIGVMEHIEEAGIHSGDCACSLPPYSLSKEIVAQLKTQTRALARRPARSRPDERAICDQGRRDLCDRGESPRQPNRAVCFQGDGRAMGEDRGEGDGRQIARRAWARWSSPTRRTSR